MTHRKFKIDQQVITIDSSKIKKYFSYPECFVKDGNELYVFNQKVFVSEDMDYCQADDCSIRIPDNLLDKQGNQLCACAEDFALDSVQGFIYNNKLHFVALLEEVFE